LTFGGERRADQLALEQLEAVVRGVADELASWRSRTLKAESEMRELSGRGSGAPRVDPETRSRLAELETENKHLRLKVDAARSRVQALLGRLTFLEEQARDSAGNGGGGGGGGGSGGSAGGATR
jgi:FtsZ-binding cell division protein ZapB